MMLVGAALKGYAIEAADGAAGSVSEFLFDDTTWKIRWLVVNTGNWLSGRKVLLHPSSIGQPDYDREVLPVSLTKAKIQASPDIMRDAPVSVQMQSSLYDYYGWDPLWGGGYLGPISMAHPLAPPPYFGAPAVREALDEGTLVMDGDPHLRSSKTVTGYHIHAEDGHIGHLENLLIDDATWTIRYLIVDTSNWWIGKHVLVSPYAVRRINWSDQTIDININKARLTSSPPWDPLTTIDLAYEQRLHRHYNWPGYGW